MKNELGTPNEIILNIHKLVLISIYDSNYWYLDNMLTNITKLIRYYKLFVTLKNDQYK